MIRCVVFDIDDTLYLERDYVRSGFEAAGDWYRRQGGDGPFAATAWGIFESGGRGRIFDQTLSELGAESSEGLIDGLVAAYRAHSPRIRLLPDALACLDTLHGQVRLAAISDGPLESQERKARALSLSRWMDEIILTASFGPGYSKPHPRAFELVQRATGCSARDCVYLADNPAKDFAAPFRLGWRSVRVRRPQGLHHSVASGPDVQLEIRSLDELPFPIAFEAKETPGNGP